jgi:diguanylate cyclase (GGDEF)-like protein/PAS domain S-box-containing protein
MPERMTARNLFASLHTKRTTAQDSAEYKVAEQCVALLYEQALSGYAISVLNAALLVFVFWELGSHEVLLLWGGTLVLVTAVRVAIVLAWRRRQPLSASSWLWRDRFIFSSALGGALWGVAGAYLFPPDSVVHQMFLGFVIGGMAAGALPYLSPVRGAYLAYLFPSMLPIAVRLLAAGSPVTSVMGVLVALFALMMWLASRRMHQAIIESLNLRFEKSALARSLDQMNVQLHSEISGRAQAERAADEAARRAQALADAPFEGLFIHEHGKLLVANQALLDMLGIRAEEAIGRSLLDFVVPEVRPAMMKELGQQSGRSLETTGLRADGSTFPVELRGRDIPYEGRTVRVVSIRDISERKLTEERLRQLTNYDPLTGLANRALFHEHVKQAITHAQRHQHSAALIYIDFDNFKIVNDTLGYAVGDQFLCLVAERLKGSMRGEDTIARLGGDEFALMADAANGIDDALVMVQRVRTAMQEHFHSNGQEIFGSASVGIALYPQDGTDPDALLRNAEVALYRAKEKGRDHYEFFAHEMNVQVKQRFELETSLHRALGRGEFELHYQPKVAMYTGKIIGVEALIRWRHPQKGLIPPLDFIPIAEKTGLIIPIGEWVLESVCDMLKRRAQLGLSALPVAVNLSLLQLKQKDIVRRIAGILERYRVPAEQLELEITESVLADDVTHAADILRSLHEMGITFSIDDFGTGYSSLGYLKRFPVSYLKVDRSFTSDLPGNGANAAMVRVISAIGDSFGLKVVAEGVETATQLEFLQSCGCYAAQGYFLSRPIPEEDLADWLVTWDESIDHNGEHAVFADIARRRREMLKQLL